jgi:hypothetical protein
MRRPEASKVYIAQAQRTAAHQRMPVLIHHSSENLSERFAMRTFALSVWG